MAHKQSIIRVAHKQSIIRVAHKQSKYTCGPQTVYTSDFFTNLGFRVSNYVAHKQSIIRGPQTVYYTCGPQTVYYTCGPQTVYNNVWPTNSLLY